MRSQFVRPIFCCIEKYVFVRMPPWFWAKASLHRAPRPAHRPWWSSGVPLRPMGGGVDHVTPDMWIFREKKHLCLTLLTAFQMGGTGRVESPDR